MEWLIFVHIGPVQDFIMSARRCRDLWYGSQLLSELSKAAASAIHRALQDGRGSLVFPGSLEGEDTGVANKIVAHLQNTDAAGCTAVAESAREAMHARLSELARDTFDAIEDRSRPGNFQRALADAHVRECMEFLWVAVPIEDDYASARKRGEALLAARKNTRNWTRFSLAPPGIPKSSLDGARESVLHERVYDRRSDHYVAPNDRHRAFGVKGEERLCGIGILKRVGNSPSARAGDEHVPVFHSSAHTASGGLRRRLASAMATSSAVGDAYQHWLNTLVHALGEQGVNDLRIRAAETPWTQDTVSTPSVLPLTPHPTSHGLDGVLLYPQRLKELTDIYEGGAEVHAAFEPIRHAQKALLASLGIVEPYPYYAMIVADGDHMGRTLDALSSPDAHRSFSDRLDAEFAGRAKAIVESFGGTLIFAGGDDVVAMTPVITACQTARALRNQFLQSMSALPHNVQPTLSVGIGIGHFMTPFANVRALAKSAEQIAKQSGRNALAIRWKKRGAAPRHVVEQWSDGPDSLDARLTTLADLLHDASVPRALSHQLLETLDITGPDGPTADDDAMLTSLATRVIRRRGLSPADEAAFLDLLHPRTTATAQNPSPTGARIRALANELLLANELRIARQEAGLTSGSDQVQEAGE